MSDHQTKGHPIAGLIMVLIISGLFTYAFGVMNSGQTAQAAAAGVLIFGIGAYAVLGLAKE